jgi:hypothetical protein
LVIANASEYIGILRSYKTEFHCWSPLAIVQPATELDEERHAMTCNPAIDDSHCDGTTGIAPSSSGLWLARVRAAVVGAPTGDGCVAVNKYFRLAAFGLVWAVLNMALVDCAFELTFKQPPFHIAQVFSPPR